MLCSLFKNSLIKYGSHFKSYSILNKPLITLNKNILQLQSPINITVCNFSIESEGRRLLNLNDMGQLPDAHKKRKRWGRGIGSGRGKNAGFGHQKSRVTPRAFEGGQTPMYKRLPKIGFFNHTHHEFQVLNLDKIQHFISMGRLIPKENELITMRDLLASGIISQVKEGVKVLASGKEIFTTPLHLEVSACSKDAIAVIEAAGGTVTCTHFNRLALRALIKPYKFDILPRRARPNPKLMTYYLDRTKSGYLSPEIQLRNIKLFGTVTSEEKYRKEHDAWMEIRRVAMKEESKLKIATDSSYSTYSTNNE